MAAQAAQDRKFNVSGPAVGLSAHAAEVLTLAIHELATNSVKYGALGDGDGRISISWNFSGAESERHLELTWRETGLAQQVGRIGGFGTELIEKRVPYELNGRGELRFEPDRLTATIAFPLELRSSILETETRRQIESAQ